MKLTKNINQIDRRAAGLSRLISGVTPTARHFVSNVGQPFQADAMGTKERQPGKADLQLLGRHSKFAEPDVRCLLRPRTWLTSLLLTLAIVLAARAQEGDEQKRDLAKTEAVVLWTGLAIVSILIVGIGLIWGVTRAAKRIVKKREPVHTEMPNIWYLNPPEKRKQDES